MTISSLIIKRQWERVPKRPYKVTWAGWYIVFRYVSSVGFGCVRLFWCGCACTHWSGVAYFMSHVPNRCGSSMLANRHQRSVVSMKLYTMTTIIVCRGGYTCVCLAEGGWDWKDSRHSHTRISFLLLNDFFAQPRFWYAQGILIHVLNILIASAIANDDANLIDTTALPVSEVRFRHLCLHSRVCAPSIIYLSVCLPVRVVPGQLHGGYDHRHRMFVILRSADLSSDWPRKCYVVYVCMYVCMCMCMHRIY